jgi:hypothetical protein
MAEDKPKRREHGCLSLLLGLGFIVLVLTLLFGWDIGGRHYGIVIWDGQIKSFQYFPLNLCKIII